jgi:hypothetical protein
VDQNKGLREILRAKSALRMTAFRFFPQPVQPFGQVRGATVTLWMRKVFFVIPCEARNLSLIEIHEQSESSRGSE